MNQYSLRKGNSPNRLLILVDEFKSVAQFDGMDGPGIVIEVAKYNINDILSQMLEDYTKDQIIEKLEYLNN